MDSNSHLRDKRHSPGKSISWTLNLTSLLPQPISLLISSMYAYLSTFYLFSLTHTYKYNINNWTHIFMLTICNSFANATIPKHYYEESISCTTSLHYTFNLYTLLIRLQICMYFQTLFILTHTYICNSLN